MTLDLATSRADYGSGSSPLSGNTASRVAWIARSSQLGGVVAPRTSRRYAGVATVGHPRRRAPAEPGLHVRRASLRASASPGRAGCRRRWPAGASRPAARRRRRRSRRRRWPATCRRTPRGPGRAAPGSCARWPSTVSIRCASGSSVCVSQPCWVTSTSGANSRSSGGTTAWNARSQPASRGAGRQGDVDRRCPPRRARRCRSGNPVPGNSICRSRGG